MTIKEIIYQAINEVVGEGSAELYEKSNHPAYQIAVRVADMLSDELLDDVMNHRF